MTSPASVEKLKADWLRDPCWDIEETEGFEGYRSALLQFRRETEVRWAHERAERERRELEANPAYWLKELVTEIRTMNSHLANVDSRLDYIAQLYGTSGRG